MVLEVRERLELLYNWLYKTEKFESASACLDALNAKIEEIEDLYSGIPKVANPGLETGGRMYPIQEDNVFMKENGSFTCYTLGHVIYITNAGSIAIVHKDLKMAECIKQ